MRSIVYAVCIPIMLQLYTVNPFSPLPCPPSVDPITGGPCKPEEKKSVLDDMTEEEKEREAEKLQDLFAKMERQDV